MQREVLAIEQRATQQQEAQTIGTKLIHQLVRVGKVTERFTHLAAVITRHHTGGDDITVGVFVLLTGLAKGTDLGQGGVDGMHVVEPRPHLADVFNDEVRRVILLKLGLVFKRIMQLGKRHAAALEPTVQHLINAGKCLAVDFKSNVIHPRAVVIIQRHAAQLLQLRV